MLDLNNLTATDTIPVGSFLKVGQLGRAPAGSAQLAIARLAQH